MRHCLKEEAVGGIHVISHHSYNAADIKEMPLDVSPDSNDVCCRVSVSIAMLRASVRNRPRTHSAERQRVTCPLVAEKHQLVTMNVTMVSRSV